MSSLRLKQRKFQKTSDPFRPAALFQAFAMRLGTDPDRSSKHPIEPPRLSFALS